MLMIKHMHMLCNAFPMLSYAILYYAKLCYTLLYYAILCLQLDDLGPWGSENICSVLSSTIAGGYHDSTIEKAFLMQSAGKCLLSV